VGGLLGGWAAAQGLMPGATVPDPSDMLPLVPDAARVGPPPIIRAGTQLTYYLASASIPGVYDQLVQDPNGNWVSKQTGERFGAQSVPGSSGEGYNVVQVGHVDPQVAQVSSRHYLLDSTTKTCTIGFTGGVVGHAGCVADYWIHPDVLKTVAEVNRDGVSILRMPYPLNGRVYQAIRFQTDNAQGYHAYVYDLATGLMIYEGSRTQGANVLTPPIGGPGQAGVGAGSTMLTTGWIVQAKHVEVPWKDQAALPWVAQIQQLTYQGSLTTVMQAAPPLHLPMTVTITPNARGLHWLRYTAASTVQSLYGMPPQQDQRVDTCGAATLGGLWLPPQAMRALQQGQVLDRNDVVHTTLTVTQVGGGTVTITEMGPRHRTDWMYDASSGVLTAMSTSQQVGMATMTRRVQLAR